jgi:pimeloyl-ACP methyl ester carboxylesterase
LSERVITFGDGHVDLEFHTRRHLAQPGESLRLRWDLRLLKDADELANAGGGWSWLAEPEQSRMVKALTGLLQAPSFLDVGEHLLTLPWGVASFSVPRRVIKQPDTLDVIAKVQAGSPRAAEMPPTGLRMRLWVDDHLAPSEIAWTTLPRDTMQSRSLHLATAALAPGRHKLRLRAEAGGREYALETEFAVIDEQILKRRIEQAQNKANELAAAARRAGNASQIAAAASCAMRAEDARRKFIMGPAFEEWGNTAHATDVNAMPLNLNPGAGPGDVDYVLRVLDEAEGWIESLEVGRDPFPQLRGLFQKAFYSRVDGSLQPYTVYIPQKYDGRTALPLLVLLHGSGGDQWEIPQAAANLDGRSVFRGALEREPVESNFILCAPLARGPSGYQHLAEIDILQMLDEVQRDYRIDADRVYVTGWSMGGAGSWGLASRFPDRFAAIMPIAGSADTLLLENTRHIPCWYFHGLGDTEVNPGFLKVNESAYQRLGLTYYNGLRERPFVFAPDTDHWVGYRMTGSFTEIEKILSQYRRVAFPRSVTLVAPELRHNRAYWVRIDSFEHYWEPAKLTAQIDGNKVQVTSHNVSQFTLFLSRELVDMNQALEVMREGRRIFQGRPAGELHLELERAGSRSDGLRKAHGLSGPLGDIYYEPFLIVFGSQSRDPEETAANRRQAEAIRLRGSRGVRFYGIQVRSDREVTDRDIDAYHLILVGTPTSNSLVGRINSRLPIRIENGAVVFGHHRFAGDDVGLRVIYPNPLNPKKYVVVCAGVTYKGLEGLGTLPLQNFGWNRGVAEPDAVVTDGRTFGQYPRLLATISFNHEWQLEDPGPVVGKLTSPLSRQGAECSWGDFRADVLREVTGADVALLEVDDHVYPVELPAGEITHQQLTLANNRSPIYTFSATGAQIKFALEHSLQRAIGETGLASDWFPVMRRPLAVAGFTYGFLRSRPFGERIILQCLDPQRTYRVATTEHVLTQALLGNAGEGYLGWLPTIHCVGINEVEAQERYFKNKGIVKAPVEGRVKEF